MMDDVQRPTPPELPIPAPPPPSSPEPDKDIGKRRSALLIIFLVVFIDLFGFGIVLPLLPRYGKDFISAEWAEKKFLTMPVPGLVLGLLLSSFSAMQFIFAPIWGRVSDRVGRRPILLLGLTSSVVFYSLFGLASLMGFEGQRGLGLTLLFLSRIGAGIAGATLGTAQAAIADSTTQQHRSRGMALIGAAFGIGFFFGPLLGFGALAIFPHFAGGPGFLAAILSGIALVLGLMLLPETLRPGVAHGRRHWLDWRGLQIALRTPTVGILILIFFLSTFAFANFEPTLALLTTCQAFHLTDQNNFLIFTYVGFVLAVAQGVLYRRMAKRVSEIGFMLSGSALMVVGLAGIGWVASLSEPEETALRILSARTLGLLGSPQGAGPLLAASGLVPAQTAGALPYAMLMGLLLLTLAVAVTGFAFMTPSVQALISRRSDPTKQGEILGVNQSASAMARILGPAVGVILYVRTPSHVMPYVFGAGLLVLVLLLTLRVRHT